MFLWMYRHMCCLRLAAIERLLSCIRDGGQNISMGSLSKHDAHTSVILLYFSSYVGLYICTHFIYITTTLLALLLICCFYNFLYDCQSILYVYIIYATAGALCQQKDFWVWDKTTSFALGGNVSITWILTSGVNAEERGFSLLKSVILSTTRLLSNGYVYEYMYTYIYIYMCVYIYIYMYILYTCICMCVHICVCIHMYIHIYIYT